MSAYSSKQITFSLYGALIGYVPLLYALQAIAYANKNQWWVHTFVQKLATHDLSTQGEKQ